MKAAPTVLVAPALAQVNLLPGDIRQARTLGAVKRWLAASVGVTALAVGTVAAVAQLQVQAADSELAEADAASATMVVEQRPLAEVTTVRAQLETLRSARAFGLGPEILWSDYLGAIAAVTPPGVTIATLDYLGASPATAAQASTDPLVATGIGTVTFTAHAAAVPDTAAWADALEALPGFRDVRVSTADLEPGADSLDFRLTGTIQVDTGALAHRFDTDTQGNS
jgi:hypothetical protein